MRIYAHITMNCNLLVELTQNLSITSYRNKEDIRQDGHKIIGQLYL